MFVKLDDYFLCLNELSMSQRVLLAHIYGLNSRCNQFKMTNAELCSSLHLNDRTVYRDLSVLSQKGYIVINTISNRNRMITSKRYLIEKSQELTSVDIERLHHALDKIYKRRALSWYALRDIHFKRAY